MNITQKKLEKSKGNLKLFLNNHNLQKLYQKGSLKAFMPDFHENMKQLMLLNTAGGITSGDEFIMIFKLKIQKFVFQHKQQKKFIVDMVILQIFILI